MTNLAIDIAFEPSWSSRGDKQLFAAVSGRSVKGVGGPARPDHPDLSEGKYPCSVRVQSTPRTGTPVAVAGRGRTVLRVFNEAGSSDACQRVGG